MRIKLVLSGIFFILFILLIILLKTTDVSAIGPENTSVGLSGLNKGVHEFFGVNDLWYDITEAAGYVAIAAAFAYAVIGASQLIKRKSLLKVDKKILALGVLFLTVIVIYVLFEKVIINYRPVLSGDGLPEASFPSSHTVLACVVFSASAILSKDYIKNVRARYAAAAVCFILAVFTAVGRLVSGVHWFTDIAGGVLLSLSLIFLFSAVSDKIDYAANSND